MLPNIKFLLASCCLILFSACNTHSDDSSAALPVAFPAEQIENETSCPQTPDMTYTDLDSIPHLPDPFSSAGGARITEMEEWGCRRDEIGAMAQQFELGAKPAKPVDVTGSYRQDTLQVRVEHDGITIAFDSEIILPSVGQPPYPAVIGIGRSFLDNSQLDSLGVAIINFPNNTIAEQMGGSSRGKGAFYELYGRDHSAGALMAWSWGVSRLIDVLETTESPIDAGQLGVTGCSRNGKGALIAGAFDERVALTIPQESGAGGAAAWRISDALLEDGQNVQTLRQIVGENVWFMDAFSEFSESVEKLPYDHHEVMGMVAPRALLVLEHSGIDWLGPESTYGASLAAREVWSAMGVPDRMGVSQMSGHNHCQLPDSQKPHVETFVNAFLLGDTEMGTQIVETDRDFTVDENRWIPWETPKLR